MVKHSLYCQRPSETKSPAVAMEDALHPIQFLLQY